MSGAGQQPIDGRMPRALAERCTSMVRRQAYHLARRLPSHFQVEDLIGAGSLGLADALHKSKGTPNDRFEAYAAFRIRGAMLDELRIHDPLSRDARDLNKRMVLAVRALTSELGRPPDEIEIARRLELPLAAFRKQLATLSTGKLVSLNTAGSDGINGFELGDDAEPADAVLFESERRQKLASLVQQLPARHQSLLKLYYEQDHTLRQIGESLGVTESRACQLHAEALVRLRAAYLADDGHDEDLTRLRRGSGRARPTTTEARRQPDCRHRLPTRNSRGPSPSCVSRHTPGDDQACRFA
jgi:RNA polymerase sigma factor for flagellar operon FliA